MGSVPHSLLPSAMRFIATAVLLLAFGGKTLAQSAPPAVGRPASGNVQPLRIFFISDAHSRHERVERFIEEANRERPDLVLEGGDFVHDGTEAEFRRALADRARLTSPWYAVRGNHDAELRGRFTAPPPEIPPFRAFSQRDVRFILLDNHEEVLTEGQFRRLEAELEAHSGGRIVVVMHVPAVLTRDPVTLRLRHLLPFQLASPAMRDPEQVGRFTALMERHRVLAVLSGHTHFADQAIRGGVHYIVAGALGGLTPGLGTANEYLDLTIKGREVSVRRVPLGDPPGNPVSFVAKAFRFYADLNGFNHAEQGWSYVPSASVQLKSAFRQAETRSGSHPALYGAASFERLVDEPGRHAFFADVGLSAGTRELVSHLAAGYRLRPVGSFNENLFVGGGATANAGRLAGGWTAGVGTQLGLGVERRNLTAEVSRNWATNHRATSLAFGYRF
jgi:predicted phosphodiesterase